VRSSIRTRTARTKQLTVPYTGDYQQRNQIRGGYAWSDGRRVLRWPRRPLLRLLLTGDRPQASVAPSGGYSLAIPVSLITRSYLAS
jgi:hypothetical protein